jgi:hypothetical protein
MFFMVIQKKISSLEVCERHDKNLFADVKVLFANLKHLFADLKICLQEVLFGVRYQGYRTPNSTRIPEKLHTKKPATPRDGWFFKRSIKPFVR